jgi:O-glycosyl hydrolase
MKTTAWIYWQAIENWGNPWGLLFMDFYKDTNLVATKKYYAIAQFSKFIKPGSRFIGIDDENALAALCGHDLVVVFVNDKEPREAKLDLTRFPKIGSNAKVTQTNSTHNLERLVDVEVKGKTLAILLPVQSITTFTIRSK